MRCTRHALLAFAISCCCAAEAIAQPLPAISREEVDDQIERLELDETGRDRVEAIYNDYLSATREAHDAMQLVARWGGGPTQLVPYRRDSHLTASGRLISADFDRMDRRVDREVARQEDLYFTRLREVFPAKSETVEWVARAHLRWRFLAGPVTRRRELPGSPPDLIRIVEWALDDESSPNESALDAALERYEAEAHAVLRRKQSIFRELPLRDVSELRERGDEKGIAAIYESWLLPSAELRDAAKKHRPLIAAHLGPEARERFEAKANELLYPGILAPTRVDLLLERALDRDDLTESQRLRLTQIAASLEQTRAAERRAMMALQDELDSTGGARRTAAYWGQTVVAGQNTKMTPQMIDFHNERLPAYRKIGEEFEPEIGRILSEADANFGGRAGAAGGGDEGDGE